MTTKTFEQDVAATSGVLDGQYLWSNRLNWQTDATPVNGDSVIAADSGVDDIGSLSLNTLTEVGGGNLFYVAANSLTVGTVDAVSGFEFYSGFLGITTPVSVTVDSIVGSGGIFGAVGGAFTDLSSTDPGEHYFSGYDGSVTLSAAPVASSILEYGIGDNTFALDNLPAGTYAAEVEGVGQGDVLELPGAAVTAASFGTGSFSITTSVGTFKFSNVQYDEPVTGYTATHNASTGMEVITFTGPDTFADYVAATSGALDGQYLWSNPDNWQTDAAPVDGGSVDLTGSGVDDISSLSLNTLTESGVGNLFYVAANSLTVGTVDAVSGFEFYSGFLGVTTAVSVTVDSIVGSGGIFGAVGGAFTDLSSTDPGEHYFSGYDGSVTLSAAPVSSSILEYGIGDDTFALDNLPAGTYAAKLEGINQGDVLELPGAAVTAASFGSGSFSITTSVGTFTFSNVQYDEPVTGYTATHNASTGMEVITFTGPDTFADDVAATSGALDGQYLWSNRLNWQTDATPVNGDSVIAADSGVDDIGSLSLNTLTEVGGGNLFYVAANSLTVGTVDAVSGFEFYSGILGVTTPVSVTVDSIVGSGGIFGAVGGAFTDLSSTDPGEHYFSGYDGSVTLSAAPVASSILEYGIGDDTFALDNLPAGTYAAKLEGINQGDVLELPGAAVTAASFGPGSFSITTSVGTFTFSNVQYDEPVTGYTATHNATTGMEVITFTGGPPVIASPTSDVIGEGRAAVIAGVSVSETAALPTETFTTTLTDSSGLLSATGTGVTGSGTKSLTLTGTLTQVNADLATLKDIDAITGSDSIDITTLDQFGFSATAKTIGITVNGRPTIAAPTNDEITLDLDIAIPGVSLSETGTTTGETFTVTLTDTAGLLSATGTGVSGSGTKTLTVTGSLTQVNADLATLKDADATPGTDTIVLAATDSLGNSAAGASIAIRAMAEPADDFNGSGRSGVLFESASGTLATWELDDTAIIAGGGALGNPGPGWTYVGSGDFTGAGRADLLFENAAGVFATWDLDGAAIVGGGTLGSPGAGWTEVGIGDFTGDGMSDILFRNTNGTYATWQMDDTAIVGGGTIGNPGPGWTFKAIGDFYGDGKDSILFENANGTYALWRMNGTTIVGGGTIGDPGPGWQFVGVGDFNGDGKDGLLFENVNGTYATWDLNGTSIVGGGAIGNPGADWSLAAIGDYNGDGASDLLFRNINGSLATWDLKDTTIIGGGTVGNPGATYTPVGLGQTSVIPALFFENANGTVATWQVDGTQIVGGGTLGAAGSTTVFVLGDFLGDGEQDLALQASNGTVTIWQTDGSTLAASTTLGNPGSGWSLVGGGDFNGDGKTDLLFENSATGSYATWDLSGASIIGGGNLGSPGPDYRFEGIGDFTGGGKADILFLNTATGQYATWDMNDTAIVGGGDIGDPGSGWTFKAIGDFTGDGKDSILFENASGTYATWDMNGTAIVGGGTIGSPGGTWTFKEVADLNGDGKDDIIFQDASGNLAYWAMSDTSIIGGGTIGNPGGTFALIASGDLPTSTTAPTASVALMVQAMAAGPSEADETAGSTSPLVVTSVTTTPTFVAPPTA